MWGLNYNMYGMRVYPVCVPTTVTEFLDISERQKTFLSLSLSLPLAHTHSLLCCVLSVGHPP